MGRVDWTRTTAQRLSNCQALPLAENAAPRQVIRDLHSGAVGTDYEEEKASEGQNAIVPTKVGTQSGFPLARE